MRQFSDYLESGKLILLGSSDKNIVGVSSLICIVCHLMDFGLLHLFSVPSNNPCRRKGDYLTD